jgi:hypothetical protein
MKPSMMAQFWVCHVKQQWMVMGGGDGVSTNEVVVVVGPRICKHEAGEGAGGQNHKTEHNGSISGVPCETAVEGDGGRWWHGVDEVVVVVGLHIRKHKV